jgi:hypothetical protein
MHSYHHSIHPLNQAHLPVACATIAFNMDRQLRTYARGQDHFHCVNTATALANEGGCSMVSEHRITAQPRGAQGALCTGEGPGCNCGPMADALHALVQRFDALLISYKLGLGMLVDALQWDLKKQTQNASGVCS